MALALYRKYRPKTFDELLGQEHIVEVLKNAARRDKIAHAYLFYGSRGTGKTTVARLIAKLANCETRQKQLKEAPTPKEGRSPDRNVGNEPCNNCARCTDIDAGKALDVIEIDAASNRGIDEIRNLQESIRLSPTSYPYKVFIIDEVHMLTREAFNALLKTLEEPPAHAIFVLATTDLEKVPATIVSRTQKFHFKKLPIKLIAEKIAKVAVSEKIKIAPEAVELVAAIAEGSLRDAESLLAQVASLGEAITEGTVEKILGQVSFSRTADLADLILKGNLRGSLDYVAKVVEEGYNVVDLNRELIHYIRRTISLSVDPNLEVLFKNELTEQELARLKNHSQMVNTAKHLNLLKSLIRAYSEMRYSPFAQIPLEVAIIENLSSP